MGREPWNTNETELDLKLQVPLSLSLGNEGTSAEVNVGWGRTEWECSNLGISKRGRCRRHI